MARMRRKFADRFTKPDTIEPSRDLSGITNPNLRADRESYGHGQKWNPQGGAREIGPWLDSDWGGDYVNPNVFERQMGSSQFPGSAKKYAQLANQGFYGNQFDSPKQLRDLFGYANAVNADNNLINPMYSDLYEEYEDDSEAPYYNTNMYKSKAEQMEDAGSFEAMQMDRYGRENPFLQELGGMETTIAPRGNTSQKYIDEGINFRSADEIRHGYNMSNPNAPLTSPKYRPSSERQPGLNNPFMASGPPGNIGMDRDPFLSLTPGNIGMDRDPSKIPRWLSHPYDRPPVDPTEVYYEDPIIKLGMEDLRKQGKKQANLGNYDLFHLMGNGYTREEAQEILNEQGIGPTDYTYSSRGGIMNLKR